MKLVYTLAGLATVLATGNEAFQLSSKNVRQLQSSLEDRVEQKYTNMKRQLRQKRDLFDDFLENIAGEINLNEYTEAAASCQIQTEGFWKNCRQCVAQQCSSYMSRQCGSSLVPAELKSSSEFSNFLASRMASVSPSIPEINKYLEILSGEGVKAEVEYQMNGADLKLSTRNSRQAENTIDCQQFVSEANNVEVKCVNYNEQPQALSATDEEQYPHVSENAIFGNWKFTVQATHGHEMLEEGLTKDGSLQIKLSVVDSSENEDYGGYDYSFQSPGDLVKLNNYDYQGNLELSASEEAYPAQTGENAECNGAGCMHLGGNDFESETVYDEMVGGLKFDCDGTEDANCNQMIMEMPLEMNLAPEEPSDSSDSGKGDCVNGDEEPADEEPSAEFNPENFDIENILNTPTQCDELSGCPNVPFVRRSSNGQRFNRAAKGKLCQDLETMPETCIALGFQCEDCNKKISEECPEYHALRSELSKKISEASVLVEEFQTKIKKNVEQVKFLHALNNNGAKAIYVQSATKNGDNVDLSIRVGNQQQAVQVFVQAKVKSADEWPLVASKVANKVSELF